jgi:hypothetical protein
MVLMQHFFTISRDFQESNGKILVDDAPSCSYVVPTSSSKRKREKNRGEKIINRVVLDMMRHFIDKLE